MQNCVLKLNWKPHIPYSYENLISQPSLRSCRFALTRYKTAGRTSFSELTRHKKLRTLEKIPAGVEEDIEELEASWPILLPYILSLGDTAQLNNIESNKCLIKSLVPVTGKGRSL